MKVNIGAPFGRQGRVRWSSYALALVPGIFFIIAFIFRASGYLQSQRIFTLFDDAMISMTYARTWAETGELAWFPGARPVQGITNPLWTAYMALLHKLGLQDSSAALAISITGAVLIIGIAILSARITEMLLIAVPESRSAGLAVIAAVPFLYPLTFWTLRGMEVGFLAFLAVLFVNSLLVVTNEKVARSTKLTNYILASSAIALGVLTRLDFLVIIVATTFIVGLGQRPRERWTLWIVLGSVAGISIAALLLAQYLYFGSPLPNTYTLKVDGFSIGERLIRGLAASAKIFPLIVLTLWSLSATLRVREPRKLKAAALALAFSVLATVAYSIWVGGDAWEWSLMPNRYVSVSLPFALIAIVSSTIMISNDPRSLKSPLWVGLLTASALGVGVNVNPISMSWSRALISFSVMLGIIVLISLSINIRRQSPPKRESRLIVGATILTLFSVAFPSLALWARDGALSSQDDLRFTQYGMQLAQVTSPSAVIAVATAGAPGYYAQRPLIDLFGKSDAYIASLSPATVPSNYVSATLLPGHNKWDYEYSVRDLSPDLVFQLLYFNEETLAQLRAWGYTPLCLPDGWRVWVKSGSPHVNVNMLRQCQ